MSQRFGPGVPSRYAHAVLVGFLAVVMQPTHPGWTIPLDAPTPVSDRVELPAAAKSSPELVVQSASPCAGGSAAGFPCSNIDLLAHLPLTSMGGGQGNDVWGWTDPLTGKEYALMGMTNGTAFVDISSPANPIYLGKLPTQTNNSIWRDIETYGNYAFIVAEDSGGLPGHGMQVFDLTQLRSVASPPVTFTTAAHYSGFKNAHTLAINTATGFAYAAGTNTCSGGLHFINIQNPTAPVGAGCFSADGYTHDVQCVTYTGPDVEHQGKEICFACNVDALTIVDVTNKNTPVMLSTTGYTGRGYTHQGWLTENQRYFLLDDEGDENNFGHNTRTHLWNVTNLDAPSVLGHYDGPVAAIDHNQYVRGNFVYQANYRSGLRILDITNVATGILSQVGFFDIYPANDDRGFQGAWSAYPFFPSGIVLVSGIEQGLFILNPEASVGTAGIQGQALLQGEIDHSGITLTASSGRAVQSSAGGSYNLAPIFAGTYDVTASKPGWEPQTLTDLVVAEGQTLAGVDFVLQPGSATISGQALLCGETDHSGITISVAGGSTTSTDAGGSYTLGPLASGAHTVQAVKAGFGTQTRAITLGVGVAHDGMDFVLPAQQAHVGSATPNVAIPDGLTLGVLSQIQVSESVTVSDVDVHVQIAHTYVGDLSIQLYGPGGSVLLLQRPGYPELGNGCGDNNMNITFDDDSATDVDAYCAGTTPWYAGTAHPLMPLSFFNGQSAQGTWTLGVADHLGGDAGTLIAWDLTIESTEPCQPTSSGPPRPTRFALLAPHPNPFNPATTVTYLVPQESHVRVAVYNALGRAVTTLVDKVHDSGSYHVVWTGQDAGGRAMGSGIYFVKMDAAGFTESRKLTLVR
jgi:choice-of-anchor B domain-containing protein